MALEPSPRKLGWNFRILFNRDTRTVWARLRHIVREGNSICRTIWKGDEMGLGKTLQIISLCVGMHYAKKSEPILIIVPCTLQRQVGFKSFFLKIFIKPEVEHCFKTVNRKKLWNHHKVGSRIRIVVAFIKCWNTRNGKRLSTNKEKIISVNYQSAFADMNMTLDDLWGIIPFILLGMNVFELMPKVRLLLNTLYLLFTRAITYFFAFWKRRVENE